MPFPKMDFVYSERTQRLFERFPLLQRLDHVDLRVHGARRPGDLAAVDARRFRLIARAQINPARSRTRAQAQADTDRRGHCTQLMLTDEWDPTLTRRPNLAGGRPDRERDRGRRDSQIDEWRRRPTSVLATSLQDARTPTVIWADGRALAEDRQRRARVPRADRAGVPEHGRVRLADGTGSIYTIEAAVAHLNAALRELDRTRARSIEITREAADSFDRELRPWPDR